MSQPSEELQAGSSGAQDARPQVEVQPANAPLGGNIIPHIEEIDPDNIYRPQPQRIPSIHLEESSVDVPPQRPRAKVAAIKATSFPDWFTYMPEFLGTQKWPIAFFSDVASA